VDTRLSKAWRDADVPRTYVEFVSWKSTSDMFHDFELMFLSLPACKGSVRRTRPAWDPHSKGYGTESSQKSVGDNH
jgi:hypothetical protein